jgi:hypothetical protein
MIRIIKFPISEITNKEEKYWTTPCPVCQKKVLKTNCYYIPDLAGHSKDAWSCGREECINITILKKL